MTPKRTCRVRRSLSGNGTGKTEKDVDFRPAHLVHTDEGAFIESTGCEVEKRSLERSPRRSCSSAVEHPLHMRGVIGSKPITTTVAGVTWELAPRNRVPTPAHRLAANSTPDPETGCRVWTAARAANGYGLMKYQRRTRTAHRVAYEVFVGELPDGLELDHLCRNRACINPAHLEPVPHWENVWRARSVNVPEQLKAHSRWKAEQRAAKKSAQNAA